MAPHNYALKTPLASFVLLLYTPWQWPRYVVMLGVVVGTLLVFISVATTLLSPKAWRLKKGRASRRTSSCIAPLYGVAGAQQARHFIMRLLRAGHVVVRPLNCGVMPQEG